MTTSFVGPGNKPVLQLAAVLQSPLWPTQLTVPALIGWKAVAKRRAQSCQIAGLQSGQANPADTIWPLRGPNLRPDWVSMGLFMGLNAG
jgi:uncharacterized protein YbdZ (MbtH family)